MGLSQEETIELILSNFSRYTQLKEPYENFIKTFMEGVSQADIPLDFVVEELHSIPRRYQSLKTTSSNAINHPSVTIFVPSDNDSALDSAIDYARRLQKSELTVEIKRDTDKTTSTESAENEIFTPHGLVDHLASVYYNKFNLFDLLDDNIGYTSLEIGDEKFVFALMRNKPISGLESGRENLSFQYRLVVWGSHNELVSFRNHYVNERSCITMRYFDTAVEGVLKEIEVYFWGKSGDLGLTFEKPSEDGIWVNPNYRRRNIGYTLENIASGFIPKEILHVSYVVAHPNGIVVPHKGGISWIPPGSDGQAARDFLWGVGYEDDLNEYGFMVKRFFDSDFPKIKVRPKDNQSISQRLLEQKLEINPDYSPTWQYTMLLNLEQRAR